MKLDAHSIVSLFHILFVVPLFLYVGIKRTSIPKIMFPFLLGLGVFVMAYHFYLAYSWSKYLDKLYSCTNHWSVISIYWLHWT